MYTFKKAFIAAISAAALLSGCATAGNKINWDNARAVKQGMTQQEVIALMGEPVKVASRDDGTTRYVWVYVNLWSGRNQSAALDFDQDGRVKKAFNVPASF